MNDFILENLNFTIREGMHGFAIECLEKTKNFTENRISPIALYYPKFEEYAACIFIENCGMEKIIIGLDVNPEYIDDVKKVDIIRAIKTLDPVMVHSYIDNGSFATNRSLLMANVVQKLGWVKSFEEKESMSYLYTKLRPIAHELSQYSYAKIADHIYCNNILGEPLYTMNVNHNPHRNMVDIYNHHLNLVVLKEILIATMECEGFKDELMYPISFRTLVTSEILPKEDNYAKMFYSVDC